MPFPNQNRYFPFECNQKVQVYREVDKKKLSLTLQMINDDGTGPAKWIINCRGQGTLKSIVGHHGWPTRENV